MRFDLPLGLSTHDPGGAAASAEADGLDGIWSQEAGHDPYLPLLPAALATRRITLGTAIAVAFPRSPMVHAQVAWDLQRSSGGRFVLGLGAQVRAHNERRYSVAGDRPAARMRDLIRAVRAIWASFQSGARLEYRGEFYTHTLLPPFFDPGPLEVPPPPIYLAAVSEAMLRVAGAEADGVHVHPLHTERHLDQVVGPTVRAAAVAAGRDPRTVEFVLPAMIATGRTDAEVRASREAMRAQVAFYASTPSYRRVLELEGRDEAADRLHALSVRGAWAEMPALVDDELLDAVCTTARWDGLGAALARRYRGRADRLMPYAAGAGVPWAEIAQVVRAASA
ncbi:MAG: TIGR03617 family F420-dependent LLM class oxidoreductase [Candidatus Dormibacteria bacterium]